MSAKPKAEEGTKVIAVLKVGLVASSLQDFNHGPEDPRGLLLLRGVSYKTNSYRTVSNDEAEMDSSKKYRLHHYR